MRAPYTGMKGHGVANVPGAWYDVGGHIGSARAVIACAGDYMASLEGNRERANHIAKLIEAAGELLKLAQQDVDRLEAELKGIRRDDPNTCGGAA